MNISIFNPFSYVTTAPEQPVSDTSTHVIVVGNEKGGSGKTTVAMHLLVALMKAGFKTGAMDLDIRQKSMSRYLENRAKWAIQQDLDLDSLPIPQLFPPPYSNDDSRSKAYEQENLGFKQALQKYATCDFLIIDCPGANTYLSKLAHAHADTIVTPMNDSFIDFDVLAKVDPESGEIAGPSLYSEMVWEARQMRAKAGIMGGIHWVVMRNRIGAANAHNKKRVGEKLDHLSKRIGFKMARGLGERVIYRELFPMGLTLLDLGAPGIPTRLSSMSHLTAKQELRSIIASLRLPVQEQKAVQKVA